MARESRKIDLSKLSAEKQQSTNLNSKRSLIRRIRRGKRARAEFVSSHVDKGIAYQIRALRDRQGLRQEDLMKMVEMNQNAISRLENPRYGKPTIRTLKRLAEAFDVALVVRFVPFSQLINWVSGTPFVENGLSTTTLAVPNFEEEEKEGALKEVVQEIDTAWTIEYATPVFTRRSGYIQTEGKVLIDTVPLVLSTGASSQSYAQVAQ